MTTKPRSLRVMVERQRRLLAAKTSKKMPRLTVAIVERTRRQDFVRRAGFRNTLGERIAVVEG
jgi:hypothetical protein